MKLNVHYLSGNYQTIDTTMLSIVDGVFVDDIFLDASDLDVGVVLTRSSYDSDGEGRKVFLPEKIVIITPAELEHIGYVSVDGQAFLKRNKDGSFERCIATALKELLSEDIKH